MQNGLWIHKSWWQHVLCLKINKFFLHRQFILTDVSFIAEVHEESWKIDLMLPDKLWFEPKKTPTKIKLMRNSFSVNAKANLLFSLSYFSELMFFLFTLFLVSHFFSSLRQCFFAVNLRYESNFLLKKKSRIAFKTTTHANWISSKDYSRESKRLITVAAKQNVSVISLL